MDIGQLPGELAREEEGMPVTIFDKTKKAYPSHEATYAEESEIPADVRDDYELVGKRWVAKPCTITVVGSDSKRVRAAQDESTRQLVRKLRKNRGNDDGDASRIEVAAAGVTGWFGWRANGQPWPCTPENVKALLRTPWILAQVEAAINDHASFFEASSS